MDSRAGRAAYDGPKQKARRAAILESARRLIADHGADGFSVRQLAAASGAAVKTIYNLFQDKDGLIRAAIDDVFTSQIDGAVGDLGDSDPVDAILRRSARAVAVVLASPHYARTMAFGYFAGPGRTSIAETPHARVQAFNTAQLRRLAQDGGLPPGLDPESSATLLTYQAFAVVAKWAQGHIADGDLAATSRRAMLLMLAGATTGAARDKVLRLILSG